MSAAEPSARSRSSGRWPVVLATVVFGIVPATFTLLANALYYLRGITAIPVGASVDVVWGEVAFLGVLGVAGLIGYVALFFAARGKTSDPVSIGLLLGVAAMIAAIVFELTPIWLGSPVVVGLVHGLGHILRGRQRPAV